ncbi:MAG: M48 family metalloprotease [Pseudomonadota bacterium]
MKRIRSIAIAGLLCLPPLIPSPEAQATVLIRDAEIERTLDEISAPILQAAGLPPSSVEILLVRDRRLNAFVAGGRNIFLHTGLLIELETVEELLGVIAHEAGHIAGGHEARRRINLRNAQGPALLGLLVGIAAGAVGGGEAAVGIAAGTQGAILRSILRNSRAEEAAADQAGLSYLERAGVNPEGILKVLERFRGQEVLQIGNVDPYVLTHPLGTRRMSLLQRRVAETAGREWPKDPNRDYWHSRLRAKLEGFLLDPQRVIDDLAGKPETEMVLLAKSVALFRQRDLRAAVRASDKLIAIRPNDPFYIELKGQILLESGEVRASLPYYRKAVQLAPNEPLLKAGLGNALIQTQDPAFNPEALRVLKEARDADLADATALRNLATAYDRAGENGMANLSTAERYALVGNIRSAVPLARRASAMLPEGSPGWLRAQDILKLEPPED